MDESKNSKNRKRKNNPNALIKRCQNIEVTRTENSCRRSARISAAKENNSYLHINYNEFYLSKRTPSNNKKRKNKIHFEHACDCQKKFSMYSRKNNRFSNLTTNNTSLTSEQTVAEDNAPNLTPTQEVFLDQHKNNIFKCIKMKSETKTNNDLKMKIKKCYKKSKKKEPKSDRSNIAPKDQISTLSYNFNNKNRAQKVVNKILKRKRQTCRKQFRHKDITLYKLGSGNNKGSVIQKEVVERIHQSCPSNSFLPLKHHVGDDDFCTSIINIPETNLNETTHNGNALENNCSGIVLGKTDSKPESHLRLTRNSVQLHLQDNVSNKNSEVSHVQITKYGPSNFSIESLTGQTPGKHNLPIRIPERRSSVAEPLHTPPVYTKLQNGQNVPTTSCSFLTTNVYARTPTSPVQLSLSNINKNEIQLPKVTDVAKQFEPTKEKPTESLKNFLSINSPNGLERVSLNNNSGTIEKHHLHFQNSSFPNSVSISESNRVHVSSATTTHHLTLPKISTASPEAKTLKDNIQYTSKPLKRKTLHAEEDKTKRFKPSSYLVTPMHDFVSSVPLGVQSTYNYPQSYTYSQSFIPYNQTHSNTSVYTQAAIPTYVPYKHHSDIAPSVNNYNYHSQFGEFNGTGNRQDESQNTHNKKTSLTAKKINIDHEGTAKTDVGNNLTLSNHKLKFNSRPETLTKLLLSTHDTESALKFKVLKKEELLVNIDSEKSKNSSETRVVKNENESTAAVTTKTEKTENVSKSSAISCSSPFVISDSDTEPEELEETALNLTKTENDKDVKNNLTLASAQNDDKLLNSTQTRVLQTLNTLTYVVNEIIDKSGDNMPKQDKELLHKLLEGVRENSTLSTEKKPTVRVKEENYIELISSDSESSNDKITDMITNSIGTLDLSMKTAAGVLKPPEGDVANKSSSVNLETINEPEPAVLDLTKETRLCQNADSGIINLSMRDQKGRIQSSVSKEKNCKDGSSTKYNDAALAAIKLSKDFFHSTGNTQEQPRVSSQNKSAVQNNDFSKVQSYNSSLNTALDKNFWTSQYAPPRRASCNLISKPAEVTHRRSTTDNSIYRTYGNVWFQNPPTAFEQSNVNNNVKEPEVYGNVNAQYDRNQSNVWNKKSKVGYFNPQVSNSHCEKPVLLPTQKQNDYNSTRVTSMYPRLSDSGSSFSPTTANRTDSLSTNSRNNHGIWQQYNASVTAKQKVDRCIKDLLRTKQKLRECVKTTNVSYDPSINSVSTQAISSSKLTKTSELPSGYRNQHISHYNNKDGVGFKSSNTKYSIDVLSKKSLPTYQETKSNALLDDKDKRVNSYLSLPVSDLSFYKNKQKSYSDAHVFNNNVSPDYGYFSPLSKFASATENTQHTDAAKTYGGFSKNANSLNNSAVLDVSTNPVATLEKSNSSSPILHPKDQEKLLRMLPKLHSDNTLTPEQYVMEVHILEKDGCPRTFLDFYSYITKKQISSNQKPVCFRVFLEFQNAGKLQEFERAFKIYSQKHENEKHVLKDN